MSGYIDMISKDLKKLWSGLEFPQKLVILLLTVASFAIISYFIAKSTEPNWGVLYSDLTEPDAVAIVENLSKGGYPYKISDDKKTIMVPVELKEELRLMIAENDVIQDSTPGFELLDKLQIGATDFQNKLTKQRIFQGEITRTIEKIRGIKKARVQLATPERSVFTQEDEEPSASVMLILDPGMKLKSDQIKAIKNLVAYGVPNLKPEKVFVTDQNGTPLSDEVNNNSSGDATDYRRNFEISTAQKIEKVLTKLVGDENVSVEVSANMNFDSAKSTIERYLPDNNNITSPEGVLKSTKTEVEKYGKDAPSANDAKDKNYEKTRTMNDYNVSKEIKQVVYAPGTVSRMTIAVALNRILTTKEKEEIKALVISASGADETRGDTVTITGMEFAPDEKAAASQEMEKEITKSSSMEFWVKTVGPLIVVLTLGLSALFVLNSLINKPLRGEVYDESAPDYRISSDDDEPDLLEASSIPILEAKLDPELDRMKTELNNLILSNPEDAVRLLVSYIKE